MNVVKSSIVTLALVAVAAAPAVAGDCASGSKASYASNSMTAQANLVDTAVAAGQFNTLVAAVKAAGLADTLATGGPFTVFAPTDAAFAKLPAGTVESLLADPDTLRSILLYHVIPGKVYSSDVANLSSATTAHGSEVKIHSENGSVMVDNAKVVATDIESSNGVIHVIDTVILPRG